MTTIRPLEGRFIGDTHHFALRVYFEDTDFSGIVYHANYLRFCERARSDMLRSIGIDQRGTFEAGNGVYALSELAIKYLRPARFEDDLLILSQVLETRAAAVVIQQRVMRIHAQAEPELLARLDVLAAFINSGGRPIRQPAAWRAAFAAVAVAPDQNKGEEA